VSTPHRVMGIWGDDKLLFPVFILVSAAEPGHELLPWYMTVPFNNQHTAWPSSGTHAMILDNV